MLISPPVPDLDKVRAVLAPFAPLSSPSERNTPSDASSPEPATPKINLIPTKVPIQPPFNVTQAENWSNNLWPVVFNAAAPRATIAPPPQILNRAQEHISTQAGYYLSLARKVAEEAEQSGRGRGVGAVIVDPAIETHIDAISWGADWNPRDRWMEAVVAVGGDARYGRGEAGGPSQTDLHPGVAPNPASTTYDADLEGGPDLHALMRATELVARRRREDAVYEAAMESLTPPAIVATDPQLSTQLSSLESYFLYDADTPSAHPPAEPASPKKRKHEEPNPETRATQVEISDDTNPQSIPSAPLPAPPPSTTALADPIIAAGTNAPEWPSDPFSDSTIPPSSRIRTRAQGGYLCTDLDVYMSHEPCLCCSMGILLSRFRAVIFPRSGRMKSGGLASEPVGPAADEEAGHDGSVEATDTEDERPYYGLHWRKELNWRALGFEFVEETDGVDGHEGVAFHA